MSRSRRQLAAVALALLLAFALVPAAGAKPNVVVIETDDQTAGDLASMPRTRALIGDAGVTFTQSIVSLSQCCPSRATFLTGRYAHNHGVLTTQPPFGGYGAFDPSQSLATWLQRAGYQTALVGKYLNNYGRDDATVVPPGWSEWHGLEGPDVYNYWDFRVNDDGVVRRVTGQYKTDVQTAQAVDVIRRRAGARPLFLWLTYVAPHAGPSFDLVARSARDAAVPSPLFGFPFAAGPMPRGPAFNEADVSDKPAGIRRRPRFGRTRRGQVQEQWQRRQQALGSVDEGVARVVSALRAAKVLRDTLVIFTSDNGYLMGEHRVTHAKVLPYEPSIRVPLLMRGPGVPRGQVRAQLVWNGDLAPTIAAAAGARAPWAFDGRSLWPLIRGRSPRSARSVLLEGPPASRLDATPSFTGVRTSRYVYIKYATGERELYDLVRDPQELGNLVGRPAAAAVQRRLARRLARLRGCAGQQCH